MAAGGTSSTAPLSSSSSAPQDRSNVAAAAADNNAALLSSILASPNFTVASYLNAALQQALEETSQQQQQQQQQQGSRGTLVNDNNTTQTNNENALSQRMAELALQLQLQTQACHEDIGRIGAELQAILPRCQADVGRVSVGLDGLRLDATSLLLETTTATTTTTNSNTDTTTTTTTAPSASATTTTTSSSHGANAATAPAANEASVSKTLDEATSTTHKTEKHQPSSLETLSTLHALQANLTRTKEILTAAATWDSTLADLSPLLASPGNLAAAVGKLAVLEKGEQALRGLPHPEQRTAALKKFRTQVATLLQPQLVHALQNMSSSSTSNTTTTSSSSGGSSHHHGNTLGPLQQCVSLYSQLNMLEDLKRQYVNVRPAALHKAWWDYRPSFPTSAAAAGGLSQQQQQQQQQPALVTWLPTWFESVLQLLGEERRQAQAVFGQSSQTVSFVMCQVLESTFAPILSSFASRLESLHSTTSAAPATTANNKTTESLAWTAAIYESTIQFILLAYEAVAAAWLDLMESGGGGGGGTTNKSNDSIHRDAGLALYQDLQKLFIKIASPFSPYQKRLAELERETTRHTLQNLSLQIQQWTLPLQQPQKRGGETGGQPSNKAAAAAETTPKASLEILQKATDGLFQLISSTRAGMLPHAELALGRMELLQGGYLASDTLQAIDETLVGHVEALICAVETLRAPSLSDNKNTTGGGGTTATTAAADESFDEPHVLCALEVLKIAGTCRRQMQRLQELTGQRLSVLSQRIMDHEVREKELEQLLAAAAAAELNRGPGGGGGGGGGSSSSSGGKRNSFLLPDALSIVEISSIITRNVLCTNKGDAATTLVVLHRLVEASTSNAVEEKGAAAAAAAGTASGLIRLYPQADAAAKRLAHSCHTFVYDICFAVPRRHLAGMSSMSAWKEASPRGTGQDSLASYGTLPQSYITHVGEHMLALVQALEPFASDREALALANEVMDGVREVAVQPWLDLTSACGASLRGSSSEQQFVRKLMAGKDLSDLVMGNVVMEEEEDDDEEEEGAGQEDGGDGSKASAAFCNAWLDVVGLAVTGRLLERIMRIPSLTIKGCEHLNADLNYLVNVFAALGVAGHPHPLLGHLSEIVLLDGPTLTQRISDNNSSSKTTATVEGDQSSSVEAVAFLRSMEERLAAMRGQN